MEYQLFHLLVLLGVSTGVVSASLTLMFSITTGIVKKITRYNKKEKEKSR